MGRKVVHLTSVHSRFDTRIFLKECRSLVASGYDVALVVADGNGEEICDGVHIFDVGSPAGRRSRMWHTVNEIASVAIALDADVYHLHDPELLRIVGRLRRFCDGAHVVFDAHEDYAAQIAVKPYLPLIVRGLAASAYHKFEGWVARSLDAVVVAARQQVAGFRHAVADIVVVENYPNLTKFPDRDVAFDRACVFHAGGLNAVRGLDAMVALAKGLNGRGEVILAGPLSGGKSPFDLIPAKYMGVLDEGNLLSQYMRSNIGLILYRPVGQYGMATAVKLYEYMAASMPVIVPSHGDWPDIVDRVGCGIAVDVDDTQKQLDAIDFFLSNPLQAAEMGRRGRSYALANASWSSAFERLDALYKNLME